jgi:hypothetical protein
MQRLLGPLPENAFVVEARETIPPARQRVTTASIRGSLRARGGRASNKKKATEEGGSKPARGRGKGSSKRKSAKGTTPPRPRTPPVDEQVEASQPATDTSTYPTGPGSAHWWLFGDEQTQAGSLIPDLNEDLQDEIQITQNAPPM